MDKFEAVDKFKNELMDKFIELCKEKDYNTVTLLKIGETIYDIYSRQVDAMRKEDEGK